MSEQTPTPRTEKWVDDNFVPSAIGPYERGNNDAVRKAREHAEQLERELTFAVKERDELKADNARLAKEVNTLQSRVAVNDANAVYWGKEKNDLQAKLATAREALRKLIESRNVEYSYEEDDTGSCIHCGKVSYKPHSKTCEWELARLALAAIDGAGGGK